MHIKRVIIQNFRCYRERFTVELGPGPNILVGDNEAGKTTIIDAVALALSGLVNGRYLGAELNEFMFNEAAVAEYLTAVNEGKATTPPEIVIEIYFSDDAPAEFLGNANLLKEVDARGFTLRVGIDPAYASEYQALVQNDEDVTSLPIEFYRADWQSFARETLTPRAIPINAMMVDSSSPKFQNGADAHVARIIRNGLTDDERVQITQAFRHMKDAFEAVPAIGAINSRLSSSSAVPKGGLTVSTSFATRASWETFLMPFLGGLPFHLSGKGRQSAVKTRLALSTKAGVKPAVVLLEEPENHLSHASLNELMSFIAETCADRQAIVSTHSSFVANKLGLSNLILLNAGKTIKMGSLEPETQSFFRKLAGFDTLRVALCKKAVLVEGASDELLFQRAYMDRHEGKLPIEHGIDVISTALTAKRFLEIATGIGKPVAVLVDNDGDHAKKVEERFKAFATVPHLKVFADTRNELRTLEPQVAEANKDQLADLCSILGIPPAGKTHAQVAEYMMDNKVSSALKIFEAKSKINYPKYITDAVAWCDAK